MNVLDNEQLLNNRYRIVQTIAVGGFGRTYLGEDTFRPSKPKCAIKQLIFAPRDPKIYQIIQERFAREAELLERLGECNNQIPKLHAYFIEDGSFYLIQEYISGETLSDKIREKGRFTEQEVKDFLMDILPVVEYIHSQRIIHRDIKPANIILRRDDNKPVLIDFGAVKEIVNTVIDSSGKPSTTIVIGTPGFMPVEQTVGKPVFASDLYSLGLTAACMLTGKYPTELCDSMTGEVLWGKHCPNIDPNFEALIAKAIKVDYRERYITAREMLEALYGGESATLSIRIEQRGLERNTSNGKHAVFQINRSSLLVQIWIVFVSVSIFILFILISVILASNGLLKLTFDPNRIHQ